MPLIHRISFLKKILFLLFILNLLVFNTFGQAKPKVKKELPPREPNLELAKENFTVGYYKAALVEYLLLYNKDTTNVFANERVGLCYLNTDIDKSKAVKYLEFVTEHPGEQPQEVAQSWYNLAKAFQYAYRFDDAKFCFEKFKRLAGTKTSAISNITQEKKNINLFEFADRNIEMCDNAKEFMKNPVRVSFENLGKMINSDASDYFPFISQDENLIIFTTRRKGVTGNFEADDGSNTADIFHSTKLNGQWTKPKNMGANINTTGDDEGVYVSEDGKHIFIYSENDIDFEDIISASKPPKGKGFSPRKPLSEIINDKTNKESTGSITEDEKTLFFSSNNPKGTGEQDIYMSAKQADGQWGTPVNLGETINTSYNEEYPCISKDGKTMYFSSQGHNSMGGYDLFKSVYDAAKQKWSEPENLGYPINTPDDDKTISFDGTRKVAYISAIRKEGMGERDIYRIVFE